VPESTPQNVTQLLQDWSRGNNEALASLMPLVYQELRRLARSYMRRERTGHTLATTGLVHEAYLRLVGQDVEWQNRAHFFGIAAREMRRVLVDYARGRQSAKRGGGAIPLPTEIAELLGKAPDFDLMALDEALSRLETMDPERGRIVDLKFFAGLSIEEASEVLEVSPATVKRKWEGARAWLYHELSHKGARDANHSVGGSS
jgi:RNA polymerase sigma factor (TIGR02999 family)